MFRQVRLESLPYSSWVAVLDISDDKLFWDMFWLIQLVSRIQPCEYLLAGLFFFRATNLKPSCGRFLLDICRPLLSISRTFVLTVWVMHDNCSCVVLTPSIPGLDGSNNRKKPLNLSAIRILMTGLTDFLRINLA